MAQVDISRFRKIGEPRIETIIIDLTAEQVREQNAKATSLRNQQDTLEREKKDWLAQFKARKQALVAAEEAARQAGSTGKLDLEILVQDYITPQNEVISVKVDNGEPISRRNATAAELQEELFGGDGADDDGFGRPS